eukprot:3106342-Alexandrium_andersonii.AAC.1
MEVMFGPPARGKSAHNDPAAKKTHTHTHTHAHCEWEPRLSELLSLWRHADNGGSKWFFRLLPDPFSAPLMRWKASHQS